MNQPEASIRRALLSVSDKTGLVEFARGLARHGVELLSTGGTAAALREAGLSVKDVSEHTGFPEMLDGRVKTLHPKIHGGLLGRRDLPAHVETMREHGILPIDLVCVNLYPFAEVTSRGCSFEEAIENIDIGGPSMLRSAAKNQDAVTVVVEPSDYARVLAEMDAHQGATTLPLRRQLARRVYAVTAAYDGMIADWLGSREVTVEEPFGETLHLSLPREASLRYGENPHQHAAFYGNLGSVLEQLHGKELSYNNIVDIDAAVRLMLEFTDDSRAVVAILKHNTPCGVGAGDSPADAYRKAFETDPESPFGGILICNQTWDLALAKTVDEIFSEVLIAPDFTPDALALLRAKKNRRLMRWNMAATPRATTEIRRVVGGFLVQDTDGAIESTASSRLATHRSPTPEETAALDFGWKVVKHVKSNAIVLARADRTIGVGGGQTSRVDAVRIAIDTARRLGLALEGTALCSDAFFPFPDGLQLGLEAGATAVIQPGGSVRDEASIELCNARSAAMVLTGVRHFRH